MHSLLLQSHASQVKPQAIPLELEAGPTVTGTPPVPPLPVSPAPLDAAAPPEPAGPAVVLSLLAPPVPALVAGVPVAEQAAPSAQVTTTKSIPIGVARP